MEVKQVQVGITTRCNSHCKFCFREELLRHSNKFNFPIDLPFDIYKNIFKDTKLTMVQLCGNKGDAIFHPEFNKILNYTIDQGVHIKISTNGSAFSEGWWRELGNRMRGDIIFALDGTSEEVHGMYRSTSFSKVMKHMIAFIQGGGNITWQFIVFKHNEHQMEEAEKISKDIGCAKFAPVISRFYDDGFEKPLIVETVIPKYTKPTCGWKHMERVYISSRGYVHPCCYICCHIHDYFTSSKHFHLRGFKEPQYNIENNTLDNIVKLPLFSHIYEHEYDFCRLHCGRVSEWN